jgi:hypothetical protein
MSHLPLAFSFRQTHHEYIKSIASNEDRLEAVISDAVRDGIVSGETALAWRTRGWTPNQCVRSLISALQARHLDESGSSQLRRLAEIATKAAAVRSELSRVGLWREVFRRLPQELDEPIQVEAVDSQGRCNYVYRLRGAATSYIVRYHDPVGREILQRQEPRHAVRVYRAAEELFSICLGRDGVVSTMYPPVDYGSCLPTADEDDGEVAEIVTDRILIQHDYSADHFVLAEYAEQSPKLALAQVVELFAEPLALIHARSQGLDVRERNKSGEDPLAKTFARFRTWVRFATPSEYGRWLQGPNWISQATLSGLHYAGTEPWTLLLKRLGVSEQKFEERCRVLWHSSAMAMASQGSLVHLDHNPRNCFVQRGRRERAIVFDFDYVAILDPAYDLGITLHSLLRLVVSKGGADDEDESVVLVDALCAAYCRYYRRGRDGALEEAADRANLDGVVSRGRAFGALALVATFAERREQQTARQADAIIGTCARLLAELFS